MVRLIPLFLLWFLADRQVAPLLKESGWISTCDGVGCGGRQLPCFSYTIGGVTRYCYRDF